MMVLYENCRRYENNPYNTGGGGTTADFIYMILIGAAIILSIAHIYDFFILSEPILYMIMYVWSRRDPDVLLNIYGFRFKGLYLPWIYLAIRLVMGNDIILPLIGIGVGHLYYFAVVVLPTTYNLNIVQTPKFCIDLANYYSGTTPRAVPAGSDPRSERLARGAGYQWGRGHVLGAAN
jgi:Derlin-2/3